MSSSQPSSPATPNVNVRKRYVAPDMYDYFKNNNMTFQYAQATHYARQRNCVGCAGGGTRRYLVLIGEPNIGVPFCIYCTMRLNEIASSYNNMLEQLRGRSNAKYAPPIFFDANNQLITSYNGNGTAKTPYIVKVDDDYAVLDAPTQGLANEEEQAILYDDNPQNRRDSFSFTLMSNSAAITPMDNEGTIESNSSIPPLDGSQTQQAFRESNSLTESQMRNSATYSVNNNQGCCPIERGFQHFIGPILTGLQNIEIAVRESRT